MPTGAPRLLARIASAVLVCGLLMLVIFAGILKVNYPLRNDQSLFLLFAEEISKGSNLYTTIWDIKQPFIFIFYYVAGKFGGFSDYAAHTMDLIWNICFFVVVVVFSRRHFASRWIAGITPFFLLIYYTYVSPSELTQVEALIALPLMLSAVLAIRAADNTPATVPLAFLAGFSAGVASGFKIPFAMTALSIHVYVLVCAWRGGTPARAVVLRLFLPWLSGAMLLWLLLLVYFLAHGTAGEFLRSTFLYAAQDAMNLEQAPLSRLLLGCAQILVTLAPWFCLLGGFLLPPRIEERVPLAPLLLIWIGVATAMILVQRFSWWPYHWWQLLAPLFLLCMLGLDRIVGAIHERAWLDGRQRWILPLLLLAPFSVVLNPLGQNAYFVINAGAPRSFDGTAFRLEVDRNYRDVLGATAAFPGDCARDRIYVFGTPAIYLRLGCRYLHKFAGQNVPYISEDQRAELAERLRAMPPDWIFVAPALADWLERREPALQALLDAGYRPAISGDWGTWFGRIGGGG